MKIRASDDKNETASTRATEAARGENDGPAAPPWRIGVATRSAKARARIRSLLAPPDFEVVAPSEGNATFDPASAQGLDLLLVDEDAPAPETRGDGGVPPVVLLGGEESSKMTRAAHAGRVAMPLVGRDLLSCVRSQLAQRPMAAQDDDNDRYLDVFEHAPVALWNEDWSGVKAYIDALRGRGVDDWEAHFRRHPKQLKEAVARAEILDANRAIRASYRFADGERGGVSPHIGGLVENDDDRIRGILAAFARGESQHVSEARAVARDGSTIWARLHVVIPPRHRDTWATVVHGLVDIGDQKRAEEALRESERRLAEAQRIARLGYWVWDEADGRTVYCSGDEEWVLGVPPHGVAGGLDPLLEAVHADDRERVAAAIAGARREGAVCEIEFRVVAGDGAVRHVVERLEPQHDDAGAVVRAVGTVQDVTESREAEHRIAFLTHHDPLTSLPNRLLFRDRLDQAIVQAKRRKQMFAVHFVDLDGFKSINDSHGQAAGDKVLETVAERLTSVMRASDTVARLGNDQFAIIQRELRQPQDAAVLARKMIGVVQRPVAAAKRKVRTAASIGTAIYPEDATAQEALLQGAEVALRSAKTKDTTRHEFFNAQLGAAMESRTRLEEEMPRALADEQFEVQYQPQLRLSTGRIVGMEALIRWRHPDRGTMPPGEFVPAAEASGFIRELGEWVLRTACKQLREWQKAGLPKVTMAVNLSPAQFEQPNLADIVADAISTSGISPSDLDLEITETMIMREDDPSIRTTLETLRALGVGVAVDDFGTGYASLTYLKRFPVTKVKIDQNFVKGVGSNPGDEEIVKAVLGLGRNLKMVVIAEGVENDEQIQFLRSNACREVQGFFYSAAISAAKMGDALAEEPFLRGRRRRPARRRASK